MSVNHDPGDLDYAFRVVAGDTPPTTIRPFTEHGQFGSDMIDKRCILQTRTWVDRDGMAHDLEDMTPDYRANVLQHLRQEAPNWIDGARVIAITLALHGAIDAAQANREITAVAALPDGWTDHTPLGLALHHLNGSTPTPLTPQPELVTAAVSDTPDLLRNSDSGIWTVTTHSHSRYDLDLDRRRIRRVPAATEGNGLGKALAGDGDWTLVEGIVDCAVGRIMVILDIRDGQGSYRISTTVRSIRAASPRYEEPAP